MQTESASIPESGEPETMICTSCHQLNDPNAKYCQGCGAPIGLTSAWGPWEQTLAQGFAIRQAATTDRPRPILVLGVWLIFLPTAAASAFTFWLVYRSTDWGLPDEVKMAASLGMLLLALALLYQSAANYARRHHSQDDKKA